MVSKTVHPDFKIEIERQRAVRACARTFSVPEIYSEFEHEGRVRFLMEHVEGSEIDSTEVAGKLLDEFHEQTTPLLGSGLFLAYTGDTLREEIKIASAYGAVPAAATQPRWFDELFAEQALVHGDWKFSQLMIGRGQRWVIDFGRSFAGPPILDEAHFAWTERPDWASRASAKVAKGIVAETLRMIAWFHLCRTRYIAYSYEREIEACFRAMREAAALAGR